MVRNPGASEHGKTVTAPRTREARFPELREHRRAPAPEEGCSWGGQQAPGRRGRGNSAGQEGGRRTRRLSSSTLRTPAVLPSVGAKQKLGEGAPMKCLCRWVPHSGAELTTDLGRQREDDIHHVHLLVRFSVMCYVACFCLLVSKTQLVMASSLQG